MYGRWTGDFPRAAVVKNLPSSAGDVDSAPGWGSKILHVRSNKACPATTEPVPHSEDLVHPKLKKEINRSCPEEG